MMDILEAPTMDKLEPVTVGHLAFMHSDCAASAWVLTPNRLFRTHCGELKPLLPTGSMPSCGHCELLEAATPQDLRVCQGCS